MIIYNGVNSFTAFDLYVASRELPAPKRKEIVETVPYMSGEWDFSFHDGNIDEYETLIIKYTFDVIADTKQELHEQRKKLLAWVHSRGDQKLVDTEVSELQYHEVYKAQGDWQGNDLQGLLTVEFSCYPFAKTDKRVSQTLSDTEIILTVENEGSRKVTPVISVEETTTIKYGENSLSLGAGTHKNKLTLEAGENTFTVSGTGELTFEFAEESY